MKNLKKDAKGITLLALVVTIIILIILATVSVNILVMDNGLIQRATGTGELAKDVTEDEHLKLAVADALITGAGKLSTDNVKNALKSEFGEEKVTDATFSGEGPWTFKGERNTYTVETTGKITTGGTTLITEKSTLEKAKDDKTVFNAKTTVEDKYGNKVVVPENFKIAEDSATDVTGGVVIEDASNDATKGSQFVWIPVGEVKKGTETKTITLNRYTFADGETDKDEAGNKLEKGTPIGKGNAGIPVIYAGFSYLVTETLTKNGNEVADGDVYNAFVEKTEEENTKTKVEKTGGYYIGRYEARTPSPLSAKPSSDIPSSQLTEKADDSVYNYVTQPQASKLCKNMYQGKTFKSDLMNSYAWDTAIVFLQTFDDREEKGTPYSYQNSLNAGVLATSGTNNLDATEQDKICNIWDMASNCDELTTETCGHVTCPCTRRGDTFLSGRARSSFRAVQSGDYSFQTIAFRPLLMV